MSSENSHDPFQDIIAYDPSNFSEYKFHFLIALEFGNYPNILDGTEITTSTLTGTFAYILSGGFVINQRIKIYSSPELIQFIDSMDYFYFQCYSLDKIYFLEISE